ncbi:Hypothetical protein NocV09_00801320 [Nannochloropsis oceanica]
MVNDTKPKASLDGAFSPPSSSAAYPSPAMTSSAAVEVATASPTTPSSPHAVTYPSPPVLMEALGFVLNQDGLVGLSTKKSLLTVSKDVCDTTRSSILRLRGDERLFPILGKFRRLSNLSITFGDYSSRAWYQPAGVDLSVVAPLLKNLKISTLEKPEREKSKMKKKKGGKGIQSMAEKKTGGGGLELIALDPDEVGEGEQVSTVDAAGEGMVQNAGKHAEKGLSKRNLNPRGGKHGKKRRFYADVGNVGSDIEPAAGDTAALKVAREPCTLLTGLRSLRCLTTINLRFDEEIGIAAERWIEEQLPSSLEYLTISGPEVLELGFGPLTRLVRAGKLPKLVYMRFERKSSAALFPSASPDMTIRLFINLLTSLTRVTTPRLHSLYFCKDNPTGDEDGSDWLDQLFCSDPKWETETEALLHWAADGERPPHLHHLYVESRTAVPKLLRTRDPRLVELGTLLYASVDGRIFCELDLDCVVAWVDQLDECNSYYARAQAVRALDIYVKSDETYYLDPTEYPDLYHRTRVLLYELVRVALAAPTGKEGENTPDQALSLLAYHLLAMVSFALESTQNFPLFHVSDVDFEAIAVIAVKVIAFRFSEDAYLDASFVLLRILRQDLPVRGVWELNMAAMADRGFRATKEERKEGLYGDLARYTPSATVDNGMVRAVMMIRLVLHVIFEQPCKFILKSLVKLRMETLLFLLSENVALMFEALRAERLLASVVAALFQDDCTPSILWICSHLDIPRWVPGFIVDVLLRRIEAPTFKGFAKYLTSMFATSSKKIPSGLPIDPSRYRVDTGRVLILETLLAPERSSAFITALAADAKQVGSMTLFNMLKEVASRGLLGSGGIVSAWERQQLGEAVDVLKLASDASPEALCVLRALKGEPVDHLCDVLERIKIVAIKTKSGRMRPFKASLFDELIVSLAGLDAVSTSTQPVISTSFFSKSCTVTSLYPLPAAAATACASSSSSSLYLSLCSNLDAALNQLGEKEVINRLFDFIEKCKIQRKKNVFGVPQGKQQWKVSQLRIVALALSSLTIFSEIFVKMLAGPGIRALAARQAASGTNVSKAMDATIGKMTQKHGSRRTSSHSPAPRSSEDFLELWIEVIASVENVPVIAFGLARAATRVRDVLRGLCNLAAYSGSNVGRLARALAMLTTTRARFPHDLSRKDMANAVGGRTDGEGGGNIGRGGGGGGGGGGGRGGGGDVAAASNFEGAPSDKQVQNAGSTAKAGSGTAVEHPYIHRALTFGVPVVEPAAIVECLTKEGINNDRKFHLTGRTPHLVMSLISVPAMTAAVLGSEKSSFPVVRMLLDSHRTRVTSARCPSFGNSSSSNNKTILGVGSGGGSSNISFDRNMADALQKYGREGGVHVGRAALSYLMKEVTAHELIEYKAVRTLRMLTLEEPAFALPHVLGTDNFLYGGVRVLVFELLQCRSTFTKLCVERCLPELFAFLYRSVEAQSVVSSLEIVLSIMASVPDFFSRIAILIKKDQEEKDDKGRVFGAYVQGLVRQWSSDRRVNRGNNKAVIGQFAALLRVSGEGGAEDDQGKNEKEESKQE